MKINHIRIGLALFFALAAFSSYLVAGIDSAPFQFAAAMAVLNAVAPLLPRVDLGIDGLSAADVDPAAAIAEAVTELKKESTALRKQQDDLKEPMRIVQDAVTKGLKLDKETQENIDKAIAKANETGTLVNDLSQKIDDLRKSAEQRVESPTLRGAIAKMLAGDSKNGYEAFTKGDSKQFRMVLKDITSASSSTGLKREPFIDSIVSLERPPLRILDLLTIIPVNTDLVKYGKQVLRDNKAAIVPEGTKKPYSNYKWEDASAQVVDIAHLAKITNQALRDAPRLAAEVESEMRFGLALAKEDEILNGPGGSNRMDGLIANATAYAVPAGMDTDNILTPLDRLRIAILQIHLAYATPDGHVLNPINMAEIDLMRRDPDKGGGYLFGNPDEQTGVVRLWRLPCVESPSMEVDDFLTGAFKYSVHYYQREGVSVAISTENDDDFERNQATMRVEEAGTVGVRRPYGLVYGQLKDGS